MEPNTPRYQYSIAIPPEATEQEIKEFMLKLKNHLRGKDFNPLDTSNDIILPVSKPDAV